jgi:hypothetical protein
MSLINDALKRASQSDKNRPAQAPLPLGMQPVTTPPRGGDTPTWLMAAIVLAAAGLTLAGWLILTSRTPVRPSVATVPAPPVRQPVAKPPQPVPPPAQTVQKTTPPAPKGNAAAGCCCRPSDGPHADRSAPRSFSNKLDRQGNFL